MTIPHVSHECRECVHINVTSRCRKTNRTCILHFYVLLQGFFNIVKSQNKACGQALEKDRNLTLYLKTCQIKTTTVLQVTEEIHLKVNQGPGEVCLCGYLWIHPPLCVSCLFFTSLNSFSSRFKSSLAFWKHKMIISPGSMCILNANCEVLIYVPSQCAAKGFINLSIHFPCYGWFLHFLFCQIPSPSA